jgi:hypothetical protein
MKERKENPGADIPLQARYKPKIGPKSLPPEVILFNLIRPLAGRLILYIDERWRDEYL